VIIRDLAGSAILITQPDHARLARQLMTSFTSRGFATTERRASILHAIEQHDNGWREVDEAPLVGRDGRLLDFVSAPIDVRQAIWPRGAQRLAADPVAGALVAHHAVTIYARFRGDAAWTGFFSRMEHIRDRFAAQAELGAHALARDYFFLRIADLMSLSFCAGSPEPQTLEDHVIRLAGDVLIVRPDPFGGATMAIDVPARRLHAVSFASRDEAVRAFDEAELASIAGTARGESGHST
jgi:hypothetical protein